MVEHSFKHQRKNRPQSHGPLVLMIRARSATGKSIFSFLFLKRPFFPFGLLCLCTSIALSLALFWDRGSFALMAIWVVLTQLATIALAMQVHVRGLIQNIYANKISTELFEKLPASTHAPCVRAPRIWSTAHHGRWPPCRATSPRPSSKCASKE